MVFFVSYNITLSTGWFLNYFFIASQCERKILLYYYCTSEYIEQLKIMCNLHFAAGPSNLPSEQSTQEAEPTVYINIKRRQYPLEGTERFTDLSEEEKEAEIRGRRAAIVQEYVAVTGSDNSLQNLLDLCALLMNADVDIERKYVELDIRRVLEANKVSPVFKALFFYRYVCVNEDGEVKIEVQWKLACALDN